MLGGLLQGLAVATEPGNLLYCLVGVFVGTAVGVLPGLGPTATISLLLPVTFRLDPTGSIIMLSGIYYGAMYGGSITAVLFRIPGEAASIVTCMDGHAMARQGRAGAALGIAAFGSFIAGVAAALGIAAIGPAVADVANRFGPAEYAALMLLGIVLITQVSAEQSLARALVMVGLGFLASTVGRDMMAGSQRYTFGSMYLEDGVSIVTLAMGLFGVGQVLVMVEREVRAGSFRAQPRGMRDLLPSRQDWRASAGPIGRGTVLGFFLGLLPGGGAMLASFASYVMEKRLSRTPERFGHGAIEGVAGPEAANNAAVSSGMIPLLSLGIPGNAVTALLMGALIINGVQPGPMMIVDRADIFWGVVASLYIGNVFLLLLNLPLVGLWVQLLRVPYAVLFPTILLLALVGTYAANRNLFDLWVMLGFGVVGWFLRKLGYELAPLVLAFVLAPLLEQSLRQSLVMSPDGALIFLERPIAAALFAVAALALCLVAFKGRSSTIVGETT